MYDRAVTNDCRNIIPSAPSKGNRDLSDEDLDDAADGFLVGVSIQIPSRPMVRLVFEPPA
jgi:hypothetical protein